MFHDSYKEPQCVHDCLHICGEVRGDLLSPCLQGDNGDGGHDGGDGDVCGHLSLFVFVCHCLTLSVLVCLCLILPSLPDMLYKTALDHVSFTLH